MRNLEDKYLRKHDQKNWKTRLDQYLGRYDKNPNKKMIERKRYGSTTASTKKEN